MSANLTKLVLASVLLATLVASAASPAAAQGPTTCLAEVAGVPFDDDPEFAGRLRSFAGEDGDPDIVRRSLRCPYLTEDGQSLELLLDWDERSASRFTCRDAPFEPEGAGPSSAVLEHPNLQAAVVAIGPDITTVVAMEDAARLTLAAVPASAAACADPVAGQSSSGLSAWMLLLALPVAAGGLLLGHRRWASDDGRVAAGGQPGSEAAVAESPMVDALDATLTAELARTEEAISRLETVPAGDGPTPDVDRLLTRMRNRTRTGDLDLLAASALAAHAAGRRELATATVSARRRLGADSHGQAAARRRVLCGVVLNIEPTGTDERRADQAETKVRLMETRRLLTQRLARHRSS